MLHPAPAGRPAWGGRAVATLITLAAAGCGAGSVSRAIEFRGPTMGTTFSVKVVAGPEGLTASGRSRVARAIRAELDRLDALMSTWDSESELSRFNRSAGAEPFPLSPDTFAVIRWASELSTLTGGAVDVTVGPLVDLWGFGAAGRRSHPPADADIARLLSATGMHLLELDAERKAVRKKRPDVACDFSALAPGYAADRIWQLLADEGFADFLVDVGGELRARGHNDSGVPWQIGIELPQAAGRSIGRTVPIANKAIATSGDYRNYYELNGMRVPHILDPRTGRPVAHRLASVTVIDDLAVRADGLSTALMVLGPDRGMALAEELGLAALFIDRNAGEGFTERATTRFDEVTRH